MLGKLHELSLIASEGLCNLARKLTSTGRWAPTESTSSPLSSETSSTPSTDLRRGCRPQHDMNGTQLWQHNGSSDRPGSPVFSDTEVDDVQDDDHPGDYATRLGEVMSDEEDFAAGRGDEDNEEEAFFYSGVDAEPAGTYREQLRDVLGPDHEDEDTSEAQQVEHSLPVHEKEILEASMDDEARVSLVHDYTMMHLPMHLM